MSEELPCPAKPRIDGEANHAIGDVDTLLTRFLEPEDLQLGLREIRQHLIEIASDNHSPS